MRGPVIGSLTVVALGAALAVLAPLQLDVALLGPPLRVAPAYSMLLGGSSLLLLTSGLLLRRAA